jgi:hypothetical protein
VLRTAWQDNLKQAFENLPRLPKAELADVRRIDQPGDV